MNKTLPLLFLLGAFATIATVVVAQAPSQSSSAAVTADSALDSQIEALLSMSANDRRNSLKALDPEQRQGLWLKLKRAQAERRGKQPTVRGSGLQPKAISATPKKPLTRAVGTIGYDSGPPSVSFGGGSLVGNRFDTHTGIPVFSSGTINTIQAVVVPGSGATSSSAGFVILGPQNTMGGAGAIFSTFASATGATDTLTFSGLGVNYTGSSFFVLFGDFASSYVPVLGTGSTLAQGHHGVVGYTGGMGPNITGTFNLGGGLNAFVRATGNIVPVELMTFSVE